jgi:BTB/POZ domain
MSPFQKLSPSSEVYSNSRYNKDLLADGAFGDCTIRSRNRSWRAHRNILSPRCRFFNVCFNGKFKESSGMNEVCMDDDHPDAVEGLLYYLYTLDYPGHEGSDSEPYSSWKRDFTLYGIADKYDLPELMRLARLSLLNSVHDAETCSKSSFLKNLDSFAALIDELYAPDMTPSGNMQDLRVQVMGSVAEKVAQNIRDPRLSELIAAVPEFGLDLLEALGKIGKERETTLPGAPTASVTQQRLVYIPLNEDSDSDC